MNGKITEATARLERAYTAGMDEEFRDDLRVVLDALLQPAKPEAVRLRDELRERAEFEAGKQQVGEVQGAGLAALVVKWRARQEEYDNQQSAESKKGYEVDWTPDAKARSFEAAADELEAALAARQPVGQERVKWFEVRGLAAGIVKNLESFATSQHKTAWCALLDDSLLFAGQIQKQASTICTAPPAQAVDLGQFRAVIELLLTVAEAAYNLADNANDMEDCENVEHADFVALSDALDALDALPDDQPGYTMSEPAKARWALRALIDGQA